MSSRFFIACLFFALVLIGSTLVATAQTAETTSVKVAVQILSSDRIEFAVEHNGQRHLPKARYLNTTRAAPTQWLTSSVVEVYSAPSSTGMLSDSPDGTGAESGEWATPGFGTVPLEIRVSVYVDANDSVWFAIVYEGEYLLPERRRLTHGALANTDYHNQWLTSSAVEIDTPRTPAALVRHYSQDWAASYEYMGDIAQLCRLISAVLLVNNLDADWYWGPHRVADYPGLTQSLSVRGAAWLYGNDTWSPTDVLIVVKDNPHMIDATLWAARFDCSDTEDSGENDIDIGGGQDSSDDEIQPSP